MTGNTSDAVTRQRNTQVHVLQNFAAGFRCQAKTTAGSASIVGVLHPAVALGLRSGASGVTGLLAGPV